MPRKHDIILGDLETNIFRQVAPLKRLQPTKFERFSGTRSALK